MNPILIVLGIAFFVILYQIYDGEIMSSIRHGDHRTSRKTEPVKFWVNIAVQFIIWTLLFLYQLGVFQFN